MTRRYRYVIISIMTLGVIVTAILIFLPKNPIPGPIKDQLTSTLFVPQNHQVAIDRQSAKYDTKLKLLTFHAVAFGKPLIISEQPTPDGFVDVPDVYDKLISGLHEYDKFDTSAGTVHITRPSELNGKSAAVLNAAGTLIFAKPQSDLSADQWRQLFTSLSVKH